MTKYLLKNTLIFRTEQESSAIKLVDDYRNKYDVTDSSIKRKIKKEEEYYIVKITIEENEEKDPTIPFNSTEI